MRARSVLTVGALSRKNHPSRFLSRLAHFDIGIRVKDFAQNIQRLWITQLFQFLNRLQPDFGAFVPQTPNMVCQQFLVDAHIRQLSPNSRIL
jgi:hypothetical protein